MSAIPPALLDTGITYRQLDYWVRKGWLLPGVGAPGHGYPRDWPASEIAVARAMIRLIQAGIALETAAAIARTGSRAVEVTPHVVVVITP